MNVLKTSRAVTAALTVAILVLSLVPARQAPDPLHSDKADHVAAYAALALFALVATGRRGFAAVLISIAVCTLYGGLIEIIQPFFGRDRDFWDWMADLAGSSVGSLLGLLARLLLDQRARVR